MPPPNECKHSKYKLCFTLKQHTPIIHFQSEQIGATLRATELKPKLDRFLKKYAFDDDIPDKYKIYKDKDALDYKIKIDKNIEIAKDKIHNMFFGNMKPKTMSYEDFEKIKKRTKYNNKEFFITFFIFNNELKKIIEEFFPSFLFQTNFGTRQAKGFGSFFVSNIEIKSLKYLPPNLYKFTVNNKDENEMFDHINYFYKLLRSGINEYSKDFNSGNFIPVLYAKSLLWLYTKDELKKTWDKKSIKQNFFNNQFEKQKEKYTSSEVLKYSGDKSILIRDLLGLSTDQSWKNPYNKTILKEDTNKVNDKPEIQRFRSPITFKPIKTNNGYDVYFWANDISEKMKNRKFKISLKEDKNKECYLTTPKEFEIQKFLEFAHKHGLKTVDKKYFHSDKKNNVLNKTEKKQKAIAGKLNQVFTTITKVDKGDLS